MIVLNFAELLLSTTNLILCLGLILFHCIKVEIFSNASKDFILLQILSSILCWQSHQICTTGKSLSSSLLININCFCIFLTAHFMTENYSLINTLLKANISEHSMCHYKFYVYCNRTYRTWKHRSETRQLIFGQERDLMTTWDEHGNGLLNCLSTQCN